MSRTDQKIERLANVPAFAGCTTRELVEIAAIADEVTITVGSTVITQGERLRHAYVIEEGEGSVTIDAERVGTVTAGEVLGEISMFDPAPAAATVTATTDMHVFVIGFAVMEQTVRKHPDLAIALLKNMASRFRRVPA